MHFPDHVAHLIYNTLTSAASLRSGRHASDSVDDFIGICIQTPIGTYNPDWALIFKNDKQFYFVAETKSVPEGATENLYLNELLKIECGRAHFAEFDDVKYRQVQKLSELT